MTATVEIDKLGRIVVPKKVREALHLHAGDRLSMEVDEGRVTMEPERVGKGLYRKNGLLIFDSGLPMSAEESLRLVDEARDDRSAMILNR